LVALKLKYEKYFSWPQVLDSPLLSVGHILREEMAKRGWEDAQKWAQFASGIAPTLVGGSKKHGGPDLGPTRSRLAWERLGIDGRSLADDSPPPGFTGKPKLTVKMAALIQWFPPSWEFIGKKTSAYKQVGNAFPPPLAKEVGLAIVKALQTEKSTVIQPQRAFVQRNLFEREQPLKIMDEV
jgi:DNA (cytosine-5)-methyltransferase 1